MLIVKFWVNLTPIAELEIVNDGTGTAETGSYDVTLKRKREIAMCRVSNYDRSLGGVELVRQSLNALDERSYPKRSDFDARERLDGLHEGR